MLASGDDILKYIPDIVFRLEEQTEQSPTGPLIKAFFGLLGIMFLIYLITELTPHAAKLADKLLGKVFKDSGGKTPAQEEYKVYDIYEGDKNFKDDDGGKPDSDS